jgi:hypothetical protein
MRRGVNKGCAIFANSGANEVAVHGFLGPLGGDDISHHHHSSRSEPHQR